MPTSVRSLISLTFYAQWTYRNAGMAVSFANPTLVYHCKSYDTFAVFKSLLKTVLKIDRAHVTTSKMKL